MKTCRVTETQPVYLYKSDLGNWLASEMFGKSKGVYLRNTNSSPAPPRSGWQYADGAGGWLSDWQLSVVSVSDTTDIICPVVTISATGEAAR